MKSTVRALLIALACLLPVTSFASVTAFLMDIQPAPLPEPLTLAVLGLGLVLTARTLRRRDNEN